MTAMKRIAAATDLSWHSSRAVSRAAMLARELGGVELGLVHVIGSLALESLRHLLTQPPEQTERKMIDATREQLTKLAGELGEEHHIPVTPLIEFGHAHEEIVRYAETIDAGLVVLGAHGGSFVRELFLGSTAERTLRKLSRPALIVKREPRGPYRNVLVPVDFSEPSRRALEMALRIAPEASITALNAIEVPIECKLRFAGMSDETIQSYRIKAREQSNREMQQFAATTGADGGRISRLVEFGQAPSVIREQADAIEPDLIVMGKHGQSEWEDMLFGSVTKHVIREAACDVMVVSAERLNAA
ncbi:MAG: universal stress protein [Sulfurimicrobium sp.]|nr:universal stress protein [Sulfurimicrobium sp.]